MNKAGNRSISQILALCGFVGAIFYVGHVILGGLLWEGYSHITQTISELTGSASPYAGLLTVLTTIYGILLIACSVGVFMRFQEMGMKKTAKTGSVLLMILAVVSFFGYALFPLDPLGAMDNFQNMMHFVVTGIVVLCTIGSTYLIGIGLWKTRAHRSLGRFIFLCAIVITVFGALTPMAMAQGWPISGLTERINIFTLQIWISVLALYLFLGRGLTVETEQKAAR
ncbi:MAG: DUF998 domain-containing protein [Clostridiales bacterium]|nr:DUF998 domain-containing protein [Clostridiales bacterium]